MVKMCAVAEVIHSQVALSQPASHPSIHFVDLRFLNSQTWKIRYLSADSWTLDKLTLCRKRKKTRDMHGINPCEEQSRYLTLLCAELKRKPSKRPRSYVPGTKYNMIDYLFYSFSNLSLIHISFSTNCHTSTFHFFFKEVFTFHFCKNSCKKTS